MLLLRLFHSLNRPYLLNVTKKVSFSRNFFQNHISRSRLKSSLDFRSNVSENTLLYQNIRPRFYVFINAVSGVNFVLWTYMGIYLLQTVKDYDVSIKKDSIWDSLIQLQRKYADFLRIVIIATGALTFIGTLFFTARSVKTLTLLKGGTYVEITTYKLPGVENVYKLPLSRISSCEMRERCKHLIPLKLKNKRLYYILDMKGKFFNVGLFDATVGVTRNI